MILHQRLAGLFDRFERARPAREGRGGTLHDATGRAVGTVASAWRDDLRLRVSGQADAAEVSLRLGPAETRVHRPDGIEGAFRFDLSLPRPAPEDATDPTRAPWPEATVTADGGAPRTVRFAGPRRVRAANAVAFAWGLVRLAPALAGWKLTHDPRHRSTVKRVLGLNGDAAFGPLDDVLAGPPPEGPAPGHGHGHGAPIAVILPVHNGHDLLGDCLDRLERHTDRPWRLVMVEDASTDPRVRPLLRARAARFRAAGVPVDLIEPEANLGFVGAVNAALERLGIGTGTGTGTGMGMGMGMGADPGPVVLVNSDALVPPDWAGRLVAPLADPSVASVTPMSNDSEITSVPAICVRGDLPAGAADALDTVARRLAAAPVPGPTGVGFCMALAPAFLARVPRLDTAFGRGYGEEVDWCRRTLALGGRHLLMPGLFVEHRGGGSFGSEAKRALIARNASILSSRYPSFDAEVQRFVQADPLRAARLALALAWASQAAGARRVPVYLAHSLGGGAEIWLQRRIAAGLEAGLPSAVLRVGGAERWQIEVHSAGGVTGGTTADTGLVRRMLDLLGPRRIVYSCGVGDPDPVALPEFLAGLRRPEDRLEVLFHDWLPVSPSYTLLDSDGVYRGPVGSDRADPAHRARRPDGRRVPLARWQEAWGALMARADRVVLFSEAGRAELAAAWPALDPARLELCPHEMPDLSGLRVPPAPSGAPPVIGVLGNLNRHKGAEVVAALGRGAGMPATVVLGQVDPALALPRRVRVHGGYTPDALPGLVRRYGITHWLIPSIWPETFSFTTHEALATGLPVIGFDLGAQGRRIGAAETGIVLPLTAPEGAARAIRDRLAVPPNP